MNKFVIETRHLDLFYGNFQALIDINLCIEEQKISALIGPIRMRKINTCSGLQPYE